MKLITFFIALLAVALGVLFYIGRDMGVEVPEIPALPSLPELSLGVQKEIEASTTSVEIYKWQDESGAWHYGDSPPNGAKTEAMVIHAEQNVLPLSERMSSQENSDDESSAGEISTGQQMLKMQQQAAEKALGESGVPVSYQEVMRRLAEKE